MSLGRGDRLQPMHRDVDGFADRPGTEHARGVVTYIHRKQHTVEKQRSYTTSRMINYNMISCNISSSLPSPPMSPPL